MRIFAARVRAEVERLRLEGALREREQRFRDLFDEAPIAYVHQYTDTRVIRANPTALKIIPLSCQRSQGHRLGLLATDSKSAPADHFAGRNSVNFWPCGAIMKTSNFAGAVALAFFETM